MLSKNYADGLKEVLFILDNTDVQYVNKIPKTVINFFKQNASKDYTPTFNPKCEIKDMNIKNETKHILSVIYLNYWAENEENQQQFKKILMENQKKLDYEIYQKYNPNNIFKNKNKSIQMINKENLSPIEYKKTTFFRKFSKYIISFFTKFNPL